LRKRSRVVRKKTAWHRSEVQTERRDKKRKSGPNERKRDTTPGDKTFRTGGEKAGPEKATDPQQKVARGAKSRKGTASDNMENTERCRHNVIEKNSHRQTKRGRRTPGFTAEAKAGHMVSRGPRQSEAKKRTVHVRQWGSA